MSDYLDKIQTQKKDGTPISTVLFQDSAAREDITEIQNELTTDSATVEGNPINFSTKSAQNAQSTLIDLEPIQDLHGYDHPWVGGAGDQVCEGIIPRTFVVGGAVTFTIRTDGMVVLNGNCTESTTVLLHNNAINPLNVGETYCYTVTGLDSTLQAGIYNVIFDSQNRSKSFTVASDTDYSGGIRVISGNTYNNKVIGFILNKGNTSLPFAPYSNICPISGRTQVGVSGCGVNICGEIEQGSFDGDGLNTNSSNRVRTKNYIPVEYGKTYTIKPSKTNELSPNLWFAISLYEYSDFTHARINNSSWIQEASAIITIDDERYKYMRLNFKYSTDITITPNDISVLIAEQSNNLTISFGQTVYGGTLDVENGVLVVDDIKKKLSDLTWDYDSQYNRFISGILTDVVAFQQTRNVYFWSDSYEVLYHSESMDVNWDGKIYLGQWEGSRLFIHDHRFINTTSFLNAMGDSEVVYPLSTPITINLTPNIINLLKGVNNISTDGDKITLTYRDGKFATLDGAVPKMTFRGEDYTMGIDDIGLFLKNLTKSTKTYIADPLLNFDGTVATYKKIMKQWFINNGVNVMDSTGITYLCERWYELTKQGWKGGTSFPAVGVSTGSTGTRFDDNVDMSVTPSTDTSANTDTYQGLPLFAITDCNWELDSDGNILITAIDGITDNFVRDDPTKFVGVMQQTGWVKKVDDASTQKYYYADDKDAYEDLVPLPEAIKLDGTVRSFVCHSKYMSGIVDSKMTCCSGVIPRRNISHDSLVTLPDNIGTQYSGGTSVDWSFLVWMQRIKYASLTSDGVLQGCCNYNYQYYVKVGETGVKRLILSSANGANLKVGSTVTFGAYAGNADRGQAATYSISGQDGAIITSIEDVTIDGTTYKAVYVDTTSTFDTVANGDATNGTTIVSTHHWISGTCDTVKGNDGSPVSATNGVYPAKLQGIEFMVGGYEVMADVIMNISGGYYNPYYARKSTDQATSITSSMVQSTLKCAQPSSDAWRYIQKHGFDGEIFYPVLTGTSSSEYMKDGFYENGTSTSTGTREWLGFGGLGNGSGFACLSCLFGVIGLGSGGWGFVARLSCNGNRGILLTA